MVEVKAVLSQEIKKKKNNSGTLAKTLCVELFLAAKPDFRQK